MEKIVIRLTPKQKNDIKPLLYEINRLYDQNKPGAIFAQIFESIIVCKVVDHEMSKRIQLATGVITAEANPAPLHISEPTRPTFADEVDYGGGGDGQALEQIY